MDITIAKDTIQTIGPALFKPFGYTNDDMKWKRDHCIVLPNYTKAQAVKLRDILRQHSNLPRMTARLRDVETWLTILEGEKVRCKKIQQFAPMLKQYLKDAPKHWIYRKREDTESWQPYFVSAIDFHARQVDRWGSVTPAHVTVRIHWEELAAYLGSTLIFWAEDCEDLTVGQALGAAGYYTEDETRLREYEANVRKYNSIWDKIGLQCTAVGTATDDLPGKKREYYWSQSAGKIRLDKDGQPSRVLIDVLNETDSDDKDNENKRKPSGALWNEEACDHEGKPEDNDEDIGPGDEDEDQDIDATTDVEIPLAPALPCFDIKRHSRLRIYVEQLTVYCYDTALAEKLILPEEVTDLVDLLVQHRGGFKDIIGSKGQGAVILCAGPPGTGKTLTAEVYSEAMERPLYSVQCSQLGTDPDGLEKELMVVFGRAVRWNAILLLDEADVYVRSRGDDLQQNAIVGVFLRVLEYYSGVMFMTTNRADLVDDAIASRCLARIDYPIPSPDNQARIWRTLADTAGIRMDDDEIDRIVAKYPNLSGRDVKNLLKLASLVALAQKKPVTLSTVKFVKAFKPTLDPRKYQREDV